jgi:DNA ligase-1
MVCVEHEPEFCQAACVLLAQVAAASDAVAATSSRREKVGLLAALLRRAGGDEVDLVVRYLSGELRQRRTGLGYAALRGLPPPVPTATLTVGEVDSTFEGLSGLSGAGSTAGRRRAFTRLMSRATEPEQRLLSGLVSGELRQGAAAGVMTEAVATAGGVSVADVRVAVTLAGSLPPVADALLTGGGLGQFRLRLGTPVAPMLAKSAASMEAAFGTLVESGLAGVEWKLDGIRVQIHRSGADVAVFSRSGDDLTSRVPDLVEQVRGVAVESAVLDAEALVLRPDGRPARFQVTGSRVGRTVDVAGAVAAAPLSLVAFDLLHRDGADLIAEPATKRWEALDDTVPTQARIPRLLTDDPTGAAAFVADAVARGHEGGVLKAASSAYLAGRRGAGWVKVKPRIVLDLVVLAAEWGHGRRTGTLSTIHLGAVDPSGAFGPPGGFVMLGKTFKGMTDRMLAWQTARFGELATSGTDGWVVPVRPEQVVEVAIDGVQESSRYPAGVALRFARVLRYRDDKRPDEVDTVTRVRALLT